MSELSPWYVMRCRRGGRSRGACQGAQDRPRVGVGWSAFSCLSCPQWFSGEHNLCATTQGTIVRPPGGFADRLRVQWIWARPLRRAWITDAGPLVGRWRNGIHPAARVQCLSSARVGVIGIGGLGHMALQFASNGAARCMPSRRVTARKLRRSSSGRITFIIPAIREP